jgi:hypothetical protein
LFKGIASIVEEIQSYNIEWRGRADETEDYRRPENI